MREGAALKQLATERYAYQLNVMIVHRSSFGVCCACTHAATPVRRGRVRRTRASRLLARFNAVQGRKWHRSAASIPVLQTLGHRHEPGARGAESECGCEVATFVEQSHFPLMQTCSYVSDHDALGTKEEGRAQLSLGISTGT